MGCKCYVRGLNVPRVRSYRDTGAEQPVRGKARLIPVVAAVSALLGVAVGLSVSAAQPVDGPSAGSLAGGPGTARLTALTLPAAQSRGASTPVVAPLGRLTEADLIVIAPGSIAAKTLTAIGRLSGVAATQSVEAGALTVKNTSAIVLGVNPSTFRGYTPKATAASNQLWQSVANGAIVVSSTLGKQDGLSLGGAVSVAGAKRQSLRVGGLGTVGIAGVDAVVSNAVAHALGMPASNAVVISAPHTNLASLIMRVKAITPANTGIEPLTSQTAGGVVSQTKITTLLNAALSRVGMPYTYGAAGPKSFDCSGLVQWSFARAGVGMPRVAADQAMTGPAVPITQLEPGDLLFYRTERADPAYISHVAIYIGNGKMIQAPQTGQKVQVVAANTALNFAGAVSVDPTIAAGLAG
jgi:cell wall-associated NlpC family hydrolase